MDRRICGGLEENVVDLLTADQTLQKHCLFMGKQQNEWENLRLHNT